MIGNFQAWPGPLFRLTGRLAIVVVLGLSLDGCTGDSPLEPEESHDGQPAIARPAELEVAAAKVGNITDLGTLGGDEAQATAINANGDIVGTISSGGLRQPFLWRTGTLTHISTGIDDATAEAISDAGQVFGGHPAYSWQNGTAAELPTLPNPCSSSSFAVAVNVAGQAVGWGDNSSCDTKPLLWENGQVRDLGSLGENFGGARDINDNGQVVGYSSPYAFLWENGRMRSLGTLGGYSEAFAINSSGQVVGASSVSDGTDAHAVLWTDGVISELGTLGGSTSYALDINDQGQVVGYSTTAVLGRTHAFWWQNGVMSDLGTLGGDRMVASAINNSGQVVGESNVTVHGPAHAVRWTIPTTNFWSVRAQLPLARRALAVGAANGLLYAMGGVDELGSVLKTTQAYDPGTNRWSSKAALPFARQLTNGAATIAGTIYIAGGQNAAGLLASSLFAYSAGTNTWTTKAVMPVVGGCGGSAAIAGKLYVFSGCTRLGTGAQGGAGLLHRYDPSTNSWTTLRSAPVVHSQPVVAAIGGKLYVAGGSNSAATASRRLDVYDPATNTWVTRTGMPTARAAAAGAAIGGKLYVMGGRNGTTYLDTVEAYDPVADSWSTRAPLITVRAELGAGATGQLIYAVGGRNNHRLFLVNERYTP